MKDKEERMDETKNEEENELLVNTTSGTVNIIAEEVEARETVARMEKQLRDAQRRLEGRASHHLVWRRSRCSHLDPGCTKVSFPNAPITGLIYSKVFTIKLLYETAFSKTVTHFSKV